MNDWENDYPDQPGDGLIVAGWLALAAVTAAMPWLAPLLRGALAAAGGQP